MDYVLEYIDGASIHCFASAKDAEEYVGLIKRSGYYADTVSCPEMIEIAKTTMADAISDILWQLTDGFELDERGVKNLTSIAFDALYIIYDSMSKALEIECQEGSE